MDPLRSHPLLVPHFTKYQLMRLQSPYPEVANDAWHEIRQLYLTKWAAVAVVMEEFDNQTRISFLIERADFKCTDKDVNQLVAVNRPIYYKSDEIYCRTVGESLLAIVYGEGKWVTDYEGDWQVWWQQNKEHYQPE